MTCDFPSQSVFGDTLMFEDGMSVGFGLGTCKRMDMVELGSIPLITLTRRHGQHTHWRGRRFTVGHSKASPVMRSGVTTKHVVIRCTSTTGRHQATLETPSQLGTPTSCGQDFPRPRGRAMVWPSSPKMWCERFADDIPREALPNKSWLMNMAWAKAELVLPYAGRHGNTSSRGIG